MKFNLPTFPKDIHPLSKLHGVWFVYLVECSDGSYYTGITNDPKRREADHNSDKRGSKYTRARQPVRLVYCEQHLAYTVHKREYKIRKLSHKQKQELIDYVNTLDFTRTSTDALCAQCKRLIRDHDYLASPLTENFEAILHVDCNDKLFKL